VTWVDGAAIGIVVISALFSLVRGFVREVLGIGAWLGAALAALRFYPNVQPYVASVVAAKNFVVPISAGLVFIVVLILLSILSAWIGGMIRESALSGLDRSLGLVFGVLRGGVIVCLIYIALSLFLVPSEWPAPVTNSRFLPQEHAGAVMLVSLLPPQYQPQVNPLPSSAPPSANTLMQEPVSGNALQPAGTPPGGSPPNGTPPEAAQPANPQ
jgi:membrane protein required for colicin V production